MALKPYALTTVAHLRQWMQQTLDPTEDEDAEMERTINTYSALAKKKYEREFTPTPALDNLGDDSGDPVEKIFEYDPEQGAYLPLVKADLRELETISIDGVELAEGDYTLYPRGGTDEGTYHYVYLKNHRHRHGLGHGLDWDDEWSQDVVISGRWGMLEVPEAAETAVLIACANTLLSPAGMASTRTAGEEYADIAQPGGAGDFTFPPDAEVLLEQFERWVVD